MRNVLHINQVPVAERRAYNRQSAISSTISAAMVGRHMSNKKDSKQPPHKPSQKPSPRKPDEPPPEDEYGGGDIASPEISDQTEDDKPLR
jgi:hypothetical protein